MKTIPILHLKLFFLLVVLCSCNYYDKPQSRNSQKKETPKMQGGVFTGRFAGTLNNSEIVVDITENQNIISGSFILNNEPFQLNANSEGTTFSGKISEEATGRFYTVTAEMKEKALHLFIPFPELNNQIVELQLQKQAYTDAVSKTENQKKKTPKLIGTWRYTEVLSSGYGNSYVSMATDYFVQFKPNGDCISWTGSSAGGSGNVSFESSAGKNVTVEEWYTEGQNLIIVNPKTKAKASVGYYAEQDRMMLKGKNNRVYQRVR